MASEVATSTTGVALPQQLPQKHPLAELDAREIELVALSCRNVASSKGFPPLRFNSIAAIEPHKHELLAFLRGQGPRPQRLALAVLQAPPLNMVIEARLDLERWPPAILEWKEMEGVQPAVTMDDSLETEAALKAHPRFQALMAERYGITDMEQVAADPWYCGKRFGKLEGRILQFFLYKRSHPDDLHYAHPLDTVVTYDANTDTIKDILAYGATGPDGRVAVPERDYPWQARLIAGPFRAGVKLLDVVQPEGPSFVIKGREVEWLGWSFRVGFSWREGLILHNLGFTERGRFRPVAYRAALAEIIVPYAEPRAPYHTKCAYDIVDYGLGFCANSLKLGCDCLGHIKYFDVTLNDSRGRPVVIEKAICLHEEDYGIAWKHMEYRDGHAEVRRSRRLVISFIATIANYEYGFYWYLYVDGSVQFEAKLTGIVSTSALFPDEHGQPTNGTLVAPGVAAAIHQHFFTVRLDMAVDCPEGGRALRVTEVNTEPMPLGPDNPHGVGFVATETVLENESQAQRMACTEKARAWKIVNPSVLNPATGQPVAWKLVPSTPSPPMLAHPSSSHATRGAFASKHLWVTPYAPDEMNPAGNYPLHPDPSQNQGIADWVTANRCLVDADLVLWHTFGLTHIVRPEDFPVMPCEYIGFHLKPFGFFEGNPAMDLPPGRNAASCEVGHGCASSMTASGGAAACCLVELPRSRI